VSGAAVWLANLVFRYAVVASEAAGLLAEVEDRAWVANEYLRGLEGTPSWMDLLLVWTDMLQLAFVVLAYLAAAALGAALVGAGWLGRFGGSVFVGLNVALALTLITGIILAGHGSAAGAGHNAARALLALRLGARARQPSLCLGPRSPEP
jgi:hypothetical protein